MKHYAEHNRTRAGFTLSEVLMTLAILAVLLAIAIPSVISMQAGLKQTERDSAARQLFLAAQSRLTGLRASGALDTLGGARMDAQPGDLPANVDWAERRGDFYYLDQDGARDALLPSGSIDETVRGGFYVVEYDKATAMVYAVFYSEGEFEYACNMSRDKAVLKAARLGYYGGSGVDRARSGSCPPPEFTVDNGETLTVRLTTRPGTSYRLSVTGAESGKVWSCDFTDKSTIQADVLSGGRLTYQTDGAYLLLLDSLDDGLHFGERYAGFRPGEDLRVSVTAADLSDDALLPATAEAAVNSLFARRWFTAEAGNTNVSTITLARARHLQNLERSVSGLAVPVEAAVQTENIAWGGARSFVPISNPTLRSFDGDGRVISGLRVFGLDLSGYGLFGSFAPTARRGSISNVRLEDSFLAGGAHTTLLGALAGSLGNTDVTNCQVYATGRFSEVSVSGGACNLGGLTGYADDCAFTECSASLPALRAETGFAGGLAGVVNGGSMARCYADTGYWTDGGWAGGVLLGDGMAGGLVGGVTGSSAFTGCYAAGRVSTGGRALGFLHAETATTVSVGGCYSAMELDAPDGGIFPFTDGYAVNCAYLSGSLPPTSDGAAALDQAGLARRYSGGVWTAATANATTPYGRAGAYPYPRLQALRHYGDWPVSDGKAAGLAYYERYDGDTYGFYLDPGDGSAVLDTLDDELTVVEDGYAFLAVSDGAEDLDATYYGWNISATVTLTGEKRTIDGTGYAVYLCPPGSELMQNAASNAEQWRFYYKLTAGELTCWFNPGFAKTAVNNVTARPTDPGAGDAVELRTARHLSSLGAAAATDPYMQANVTFRQTRDIDFSSYLPAQTMTPIGGASGFVGTYDGLCHGITGLDIRGDGSWGTGLFRTVQGTVRNLFFYSDLTGDTAREVSGSVNVAPLAASNYGLIENCAVAGFRISGDTYVGGFVGQNSGTIRGCSADNGYYTGGGSLGGFVSGSVGQREVGGFVGFNGGVITDCYALARMSGNSAYGFAGIDSSSISRSYCAALGAGEEAYLAFSAAPAAGCYALGRGVTAAELRALDLGAAWGSASAGGTFPYGSKGAYPFPAVVRGESGYVHYGDWPGDGSSDLKNVQLAYYEIYEDGKNHTAAFYAPALDLYELRDDAVVVQDGYALLFRKDGKGNSSGGIKLNDLTDAIACTYPNGGKTLSGTVLLDVNDCDYKLDNLKHNGTVDDPSGGKHLPLFLPAQVVVSDGTAAAGFYQSLTVSDGLGGERTFWYNPHFAKSEVFVNEEPDASDGVTARVRTERHFAALAAGGAAYWGAGRAYVQERNLDFAHTPYTETYFSIYINKYRAVASSIGTSGAPFKGGYDGGGHGITGLSYTADRDGYGVFGVLTDAAVEHLALTDLTVRGTAGNRAQIGGLAGGVTGSTVIRDVTLRDVDVSGNNLVGGLVGRFSGGTVEDAAVIGGSIEGARLVGGAFGQLINTGDLAVDRVRTEGLSVDTVSTLPAAMNANNLDNGFGTGGFAGACVLNGGGSVSLGAAEVVSTTVAVGQMWGGSYFYHGGAAYMGNLYGDQTADRLTMDGKVSLTGCTVDARGFGGGSSSYGLLFGRIKLSCSLTLPTVSQTDCRLSARNGSGGEAALGGYIGLLTGGKGIQENRKLVLTLPGGTWAGVETDGFSRLSAAADVGGVVGRSEANTVIRGSGLVLTDVEAGGGGNTGGFAGTCGGDISDVSVRNAEVSGLNAGGFLGLHTGGEIANCDVRSGEVEGQTSAGGFAGNISGGGAAVLHCFSSARVEGGRDAGGFAGRVESGRVDQCYASGGVAGASGGSAGGFAGVTAFAAADGDGAVSMIPLLASCYATGGVDVPDEDSGACAGGFVGRSEAGSILSCYSTGAVTVQSRPAAASARIGGFIGWGDGLVQTGDPQRYDTLAAMVTFYNVLQTTKVLNRGMNTGEPYSGAVHDPATGEWDTTNCMTVYSYLRASGNIAAQIDSHVAGSSPDKVEGVWDAATGILRVNGSVSYNVMQAMEKYPELSGGAWMAQEEPGLGVVVYWTSEDIYDAKYKKGSAVTAYRYVSAQRQYYVGEMVIDETAPFGRTYRVLRVKDAFSDAIDMPNTMTISGCYRYDSGAALNYGGESAAGPYGDYRYEGVARWTAAEFTAEAARLPAASKVFKAMGQATVGDYPYPALGGAGCGVAETEYRHWGGW